MIHLDSILFYFVRRKANEDCQSSGHILKLAPPKSSGMSSFAHWMDCVHHKVKSLVVNALFRVTSHNDRLCERHSLLKPADSAVNLIKYIRRPTQWDTAHADWVEITVYIGGPSSFILIAWIKDFRVIVNFAIRIFWLLQPNYCKQVYCF